MWSFCRTLSESLSSSFFAANTKMKATLAIFWLITFFGLTNALPVKPYYAISGIGLEQRAVLDEANDLGFSVAATNNALSKRDNLALTFAFTQLNNTATISLARTALQLELVRQQVISFVEAFIQKKGLTQILKSAGDSGLATDLVMLFVVHFEVYPGLINIIKSYKTATGGLTSSSSSGSGGGLFGGLFSLLNSGNSTGLSGNSTTSTQKATATGTATGIVTGTATSTKTSTNAGPLDGLFSILNPFGNVGQTKSTTSTTSTPAAAGLATKSASPTTGTTLGLGIPFLSNLFPVASTIPATSSTRTSIATAIPTTSVIQAGSSTKSTTPSTTGVGITPPSIPTLSVPTVPSTSTSTNGGLLGSLFSRDEMEKFNDLDLEAFSKRDDVSNDEIIEAVLAKLLLALEDGSLEKRDSLLDLTFIYRNIIGIIGTNLNIEEIFESLLKSGLAVNFVYNAIIDQGFYTFVVQLANGLVTKKLISLSILWSLLLLSGVVPQVAGIIIGNKAYISAVIRFVKGIFTGQVPILALYSALTS